MGVPTRSVVMEHGGARQSRVMLFDFLPHEAVVNATIRPHIVNLGNDGELSTRGRYHTGVPRVPTCLPRVKVVAERYRETPYM